jgi:chorismate synthase
MMRYLTAGESHGEALVGIVEGMPAGLEISAEYINRQLARRWLGYGRGGRSKFETDLVHIYSGIRYGRTMGSPIALRLDNAAYRKDRSGWPEVMSVEAAEAEADPITLPRPGHADLAGLQKYGHRDIRPVIDRSSARETAMRVACCAVARRMLEYLGIDIVSHVLRIGTVGYDEADAISAVRDRALSAGANAFLKMADSSEVRMIDEGLTEAAKLHIDETKKLGDSLGGVYEIVISGVPAGLGSYVHWDRRLDGLLAQAIISVQAQKAVEIGDGVAAASTPGSRVHDPITSTDVRDGRASNRAGGIEGGMSNGMPIVIRGYMKPIPTLIKPLQTVDVASGEEQPTRYERSDVTSVPAASVVAEHVVAPVILNALLEKFGGDSVQELERHFRSKL